LFLFFFFTTAACASPTSISAFLQAKNAIFPSIAMKEEWRRSWSGKFLRR
jgi:hypothetical protein